MTKEIVLYELDELIREGQRILTTKRDSDMGTYSFVEEISYYSWRSKTLAFLKSFLLEENEFVKLFVERRQSDYDDAGICVQILANIKEYVVKDFISITQKDKIDADNILVTVFSKFHKVARQLRCRHNGRETLSIEDEYDVQDLLHALLQLYFDDIRAEEWTPSYAGKSARVDFLLKKEKIVIEVKKTGKGLADKELGDQLIVDVDRYKVHPDCKKLICFVYDPEGRIGNPNGIMDDLNTQHEGFATVIIQPNF